MSTTQPSTRPSARPTARLALSLVDPGSSGIIDIHDLRAEPIPLSLSSSLTPPTSTTSPPPRPHPSPPRSWILAAGAVMALCLGVLGLSTLAPSRESMLEQPGRSSGQLAMHEAVGDPGAWSASSAASTPETTRARPRSARDDQAASDLAAASEPAEPPPVEAPAEVTAEPEPPPPPAATRPRSTASSRAAEPKAPSTPKAATKPKTDGSIAVECVLDPSRCDARGSATKAPAPEASARPAPLPAKLSTHQLKQALATTKADARRCGPEHGVDPGTTVRVKLSIEGSTGAVVSATPQDEHATDSLGRCVARALGQTEFPRFSSARMGTIYTVRL